MPLIHSLFTFICDYWE